MMDLREECDDLGRFALAHSSGALRETFSVPLALDRRLSRIIGSVKEPILGQMRLAWWRDRLGEPPEDRPRGDPVLDAAGLLWRGEEDALVDLVDAWEETLGADSAEGRAAVLGRGRGAAFAATARLADEEGAASSAQRHGYCWAVASMVLPSDGPAADLPAMEGTREPLPALSRTLRPLAIIGALSRRALLRGRGPILGDRLSPLAAARIALLGR